jgi:hypothetical protein
LRVKTTRFEKRIPVLFMNRRLLLLMLMLFLVLAGQAQFYRVSGIVMDSRKDPLPLASVEIKEIGKGQVTRDDGTYEFFLERGQFTLVVSMVGFKSKLVPFHITNADVVENIELEMEESSNLGEVIIRVKARDRAEEIMRKAVDNKESLINEAGDYSVNIYIRASRHDSTMSKKEKEVADSSTEENFEGLSLAEISLRYDRSSDGKIKEERLGVKKRGTTDNLFYLSATEGDFNVYNNLIRAPAVSSIPFISPLSYSGLAAYRFKTLKIDRTVRPRVYTIAVSPRLLSNATVEGELVIQDSTFIVLSSTFRLPSAHMPEYDFFEAKLDYSRIDDKAWMISRQQFNYYSKAKGGRIYGETTAMYSNYELNKVFKKGHFGLEISSTSSEAYEKDSTFWNSVRKEPLSRQLELYARYQDSIYRYMRSEAYLDSMDRVLNKVTWKKMLIFGQIFNDHRKQEMWILPPLTSLIQPIAFGGPRLNLQAAYRITYPSKKNLELEGKLSYGFRNSDVNGYVGMSRMYNPFSRGIWKARAGRSFEFIYPGDAWVNILKSSNIYQNNAVELGHEIELFNGVHLSNTVEYALRRSVVGYKTGRAIDDTLLGIPNGPPVDFEPYNAAYNEIKLHLTPRMRYIREPKEKIFMGSKWPTFYVQWRKGIPKILDSKIDFDYLEFGLIHYINVGVAGNTSYIIKSGDFLNKKDLRIIDYKFQRQGDPILFQNPHKAFQALDSTFPVFDRFYQGNLVHEFNGALLSKIPFMKKLKITEIAGAGFLIAPERELKYVEAFAGIEKVFTWPFNPLTKVKLGVYVVGSAANKFNNPVQFKVGLTTWDRFRNRWR